MEVGFPEGPVPQPLSPERRAEATHASSRARWCGDITCDFMLISPVDGQDLQVRVVWVFSQIKRCFSRALQLGKGARENARPVFRSGGFLKEGLSKPSGKGKCVMEPERRDGSRVSDPLVQAQQVRKLRHDLGRPPGSKNRANVGLELGGDYHTRSGRNQQVCSKGPRWGFWNSFQPRPLGSGCSSNRGFFASFAKKHFGGNNMNAWVQWLPPAGEEQIFASTSP